MRTAVGLEGQSWKPEMNETIYVILHLSSLAEKCAHCLCLLMLFPSHLYRLQEIRLPEAPQSSSFSDLTKTFGPVSLWFNFVTAFWIYHHIKFLSVSPACHEIDFKMPLRDEGVGTYFFVRKLWTKWHPSSPHDQFTIDLNHKLAQSPPHLSEGPWKQASQAR